MVRCCPDGHLVLDCLPVLSHRVVPLVLVDLALQLVLVDIACNRLRVQLSFVVQFPVNLVLLKQQCDNVIKKIDNFLITIF